MQELLVPHTHLNVCMCCWLQLLAALNNALRMHTFPSEQGQTHVWMAKRVTIIRIVDVY